MRYTERFFKFPIIQYDSISVANALLREESEAELKNEITSIESPEFTLGVMALPYEEFKRNKVAYVESCKKGDTAEELKITGFQETLVFSSNYGEFLCAWDRKKFEEKLNDFMDKMESSEKTT